MPKQKRLKRDTKFHLQNAELDSKTNNNKGERFLGRFFILMIVIIIMIPTNFMTLHM